MANTFGRTKCRCVGLFLLLGLRCKSSASPSVDPRRVLRRIRLHGRSMPARRRTASLRPLAALSRPVRGDNPPGDGMNREPKFRGMHGEIAEVFRSFFMGRLHLGKLVVAACVALAGCALLSKQVPISAANACIEKQCNAEQAKSREECAALCRQRYGP